MNDIVLPPGWSWRNGRTVNMQTERDYFAGCYYSTNQDKMYHPEHGLMKCRDFDRLYWGFKFMYAYDGSVCKSATRAFTHNQFATAVRKYD